MQKIVLSFILATFLLFCFSQSPGNKNYSSQLAAFKEAENVYKQAELLAVQSEKNERLTASADENYLKALQLYTRILPSAEKSKFDSLAFLINLRAGLIYHYFDSLELAKKSYLAALSFKNKISVDDSLFFKPFIFTGSIYYTESKLDSALEYLKQAEKINDKYNNKLGESQRLYNVFGILNFQTGNYRQAENYFEKALAFLSELHTDEKSLQANYQINIGLTLVKLEEYSSAKKIYEELLKQNIFNNEVYHNLVQMTFLLLNWSII